MRFEEFKDEVAGQLPKLITDTLRRLLETNILRLA
jgi:DNA-binding HxlR family transcriptional regulator